MFFVVSAVCGCAHAACFVPVMFACVHMLWFCVCSVCVGWWFRAVCGPSQCLAPWGCQRGPRSDLAPERPQMGPEACGREDCGACEGLRDRHGGSWGL